MRRLVLALILSATTLFLNHPTVAQPRTDGLPDTATRAQERLVVFEAFTNFL
ncbi:MAG: hypothetical protein GY832_28780 [Chloroflexi bacterium]|nr:hypothetical protein [Chloroflexota bacterium]